MADTKISGLSAVTDVQTTDEYVLARAGTTKKITAANLSAGIGGGGGLFDAYAYLRDQQSSGTTGGTATTGSYQTRVLNTEVSDVAGIVSISSNQFTLQAGTYRITGRAPGYQIQRYRVKIRNITDSSDVAEGVSCFCTGNVQTVAWVVGIVTISSAKAFALQYRCAAGGSDGNELGVAASFGTSEVYAEVEIWRYT